MSHLAYLLQQYRSGAVTASERLALMELLCDPAYEAEVKLLLGNEVEALADVEVGELVSSERADVVFGRVMAGAVEDTGADGEGGRVVPMARRRRWIVGWVAAAVAMLLVGGAFYWYGEGRFGRGPVVKPVALTKEGGGQAPDVLPGSDKAVLTTADGHRIILDSSAKGLIARQGNISVSNDGGQLAYMKEGEGAGGATVKQGEAAKDGGTAAVSYNTISVPRGGQYKLALADGTRIWLNSESVLTYPAAFVGKERSVTLTGEGYFEVVHNEHMPFHVNASGMDIMDIGTSFDVNAYADEPSAKATLLEGAVRVNGALLRPGQQADLNKAGVLRTIRGANIAEVMAWKNGFFDFERADLRVIMRQIGRWYDLDIEYRGAVSEGDFKARMPRNTNAAEVLKILDANGIHCIIKGKKLLVM